MKTVICVNDKNLPQGAQVTEGKEYQVESEYVNALEQRVYILRGVPNKGTTKLGMRWMGYDAMRFSEGEAKTEKKVEYSFALN